MFLLCLSLLTSGCEDVDVGLVAEAGIDAITAVTLSDEAVRDLAMEAAMLSDKKLATLDSRNTFRSSHPVPGNRADRLAAQLK